MTAASTYPVRVDARLDPHLSRWLWLVKWVLIIPHYIVLVFLWIAFAVMSVVAFFAILFTGRYRDVGIQSPSDVSASTPRRAPAAAAQAVARRGLAEGVLLGTAPPKVSRAELARLPLGRPSADS
jgi:hypothetical protein